MPMGGIAALGGALSGIPQGMQQSANLKQMAMQLQMQQAQLDQNKRALAARAAQGNAELGGPSMAPGQASSPGQGGGLAALGQGGAPAPPPAAGPPLPAPGQMPPQGSPSAQAGPQGAPSPTAGPSGPQPMSGAAQQTQDPVMGAMQTLHSIAADIKRRNPDIDAGTLADAVDDQVGSIKGLNPLESEFIKAQTNLFRVQAQLKLGQDKNATAEDIADKKVAGQEEVADTQAGARVKSAEIGGSSREAVAGTAAGARLGAAGIGAKASNYRADQGLVGRRAGADALKEAATTRGKAQVDAANAGAQGRRDSSAYANPQGASKMGYKPGGGDGKPAQSEALAQAKAAIAAGKPKAAIIQKMKQLGYSTQGL